MTEMDVLSKMYLAIGDLDRRLDHLEFLVVQTVRVLDQHPEIDHVSDTESFRQLESALMEKVYGQTEGR